MIKYEECVAGRQDETFSCPICGSTDILFITTPTTCYACGVVYDIDVYNLILSSESRAEYYAKSKEETVLRN